MDPSSIPKQYGGELDWKWGDMPHLDEPAREFIGTLETAPAEGQTKPGLIKGPVLIEGDNIKIVGKKSGKSRDSIIPLPAPAKNASSAQPEEKEKDQQQPSEEQQVSEKDIENGTASSPPAQTVSA